MELIPAIDLLDGRVVRLVRGDYDAVTGYDDDPVATARRWQGEGAERLHIVDLGAANTGSRGEAAVVGRIVAEAGVRCQVAGGLRTAGDVAAALDGGADRVVLGSAFVADPGLAATLVAVHGAERIVAALDVRDGRALGDGWVESARGMAAAELGARLRDAGIERFAITAIARDGLMAGPDLELLASLRDELGGAAIIASAGISSLDDVVALAAADYEAAIVGRALYEGAFTLPEALEAATTES